MSPAEYEEVVREITASIFRKVEGLQPEQVGSGKHNHIEGSSGYEHQIDVSILGKKDLILVECKRWKRKVDVGHMLAFYARVCDIWGKLPQGMKVHAVFATTVGLQSGAITVAEYYNIDWQIVKSPREFGLKYKDLLLISPPPASLRTSVKDPIVVIGKAKNT